MSKWGFVVNANWRECVCMCVWIYPDIHISAVKCLNVMLILVEWQINVWVFISLIIFYKKLYVLFILLMFSNEKWKHYLD